MMDYDAVRRRFEMLADEELITILKEKDEDRWRPEVIEMVVSILESRGISSRDVMDAESMETGQNEVQQDVMDPGDLVTVAGYFDKVDAETDRRVLQQAGLRSWITEEDDAAKDAVVANLQVRLEDFAAAIEILGVTLPPDSTFALESAATKCPRCGSAEIEQVDEVSDVLGASSRLFASSEREVCFYYCVSCKHRWSE